jgi:hypothetical protein
LFDDIVMASTLQQYLKICVFGPEGTGKTHFLLSAPKPIVFDRETRALGLRDTFGDFAMIRHTSENAVSKLLQYITAACNGEIPYETFGLDSWTVFERAFVESLGISTRTGSTSTKSTKNFDLADARETIEKQLLIPALTVPNPRCHIVFTAHQKNRWGPTRGDGSGVGTIGFAPDATRNFSHYFDLVVNMQIDRQTQKRSSVVIKSVFPTFLPVGKVVEDFGWHHLQPIIAGNVKREKVDMKQLLELHQQAGSPEGKLGQWLISAGFPISKENPSLSQEDALRAKGLLEALIEEHATQAVA